MTSRQIRTKQSLSTNELTQPIGATSWKDHPIAVASIAVAATIGLGILLVKEIILPTQTASLTNQLSSIPALQNENNKLKSTLSETKSKLDDSQRRLKLSETTNLFTVGSPYPTGLGLVRIGDDIAEIDKHYAANSVDKSEENYYTVTLPHGIFKNVVYGFKTSTKTKKVTQIAFVLPFDKTLNDSFLQEKLVEALGKPTGNPKKDFYSWQTSQNVTAYKPLPDMYLILEEGFAPSIWPKNK